VAARGARAAAGNAGDRVPGNGPASSAMGPTSGKAIVASRAERWALIDWFETDCGESSYPKESISPDNIMVKLKANAEQNATAM
jgi:hypothetical protein